MKGVHSNHLSLTLQSSINDTSYPVNSLSLPLSPDLGLDISRTHKQKMHSLSAGEIMTATNLEKLKYFGSSVEDADDWNQFRNGNLVYSMFLSYTIPDSRYLPKWLVSLSLF